MRQNNKKVVGVTGGSGSGKSYLCALLKNRGYDVIDTDIIARKVMEKGEECLMETVAEFGEQILDNGNLNRKKLAQIVFSDEKKLAKLNEISHKHILRCVENMIEQSASNPVFVEGAVLIESGFDCDLMIGVLADYEVRKERIMKRDSMTEAEAKLRLDAQQKDSFYIKNCDFVLTNTDGFDVDGILKRIIE